MNCVLGVKAPRFSAPLKVQEVLKRPHDLCVFHGAFHDSSCKVSEDNEGMKSLWNWMWKAMCQTSYSNNPPTSPLWAPFFQTSPRSPTKGSQLEKTRLYLRNFDVNNVFTLCLLSFVDIVHFYHGKYWNISNLTVSIILFSWTFPNKAHKPHEPSEVNDCA